MTRNFIEATPKRLRTKIPKWIEDKIDENDAGIEKTTNGRFFCQGNYSSQKTQTWMDQKGK